ncbi:MAG: hypothetical protein HRT36_03750 [Alphaproteobacteria bacterium]|nr:hypothetical protein [Alphaproteobacteria bacterium]
MPSHISRGNASKSRIRFRPVFAEQKQRMVLSIRAIGPCTCESKGHPGQHRLQHEAVWSSLSNERLPDESGYSSQN